MDVCIYIRHLEQWKKVEDSDWIDKIKTVFYGDYGCSRVIEPGSKILKFNSTLREQNKSLHYISPKVTQAIIETEEDKVLELLQNGIAASINDWGLLYRLRPKLEPPNYMVYIGRLLTKSIADWTWSDIFFEKETEDAKKYLSQNSFNHKIKIEFLKHWRVKGVEVNIHNRGEESYKSMRSKGLSVIGYADKTIAAVSRACPFLRMEGKTIDREQCIKLCRQKHLLIHKCDNMNSIYPEMELYGNVIYINNKETPLTTNYDKLVYTWSAAL